MAAISAVFTIGYIANLLGEDENWTFDLSISMFPEDGCLWVHGVGEDGVPAFTRDGIENLRQIIANERAAGRGPAHHTAENPPYSGNSQCRGALGTTPDPTPRTTGSYRFKTATAVLEDADAGIPASGIGLPTRMQPIDFRSGWR